MDPVQSASELAHEATPENDPILAALSDDEPADADTKPEVSVTTDEPAEQDDITQEEDQSEDETESTEQPQPEDKQDNDPEEARKEEARRRYEERKLAREQNRALIAEQTQQYVDEAEDETQRSIRELQASEYARIVETTNDRLVGDYDKAMLDPDLAMFNPDSDKYNAQIANKAMRDYNAGYIVYDENDNRVGLKMSLYQHLKETAELYSGAVKAGQIQQVRDVRKMKSVADTKPAAQPAAKAKDALMEILQSED